MSELPLADEPRPDRCETCRFWLQPSPHLLTHDIDGECRRMPPFISDAYNVALAVDVYDEVTDKHNVPQHHLTAGVWPATHEDDWCGEWQAKT